MFNKSRQVIIVSRLINPSTTSSRFFTTISPQRKFKSSFSTSTSTSTSTSLLANFRNMLEQKKNQFPEKPIVWIDCEMTGLDVFGDDNIIEICCLITDGNLNLVEENGFESTIYYPESRLNKMNEWCIETHGKSGLTSRILSHPERKLNIVEEELLEYIKKYIPNERMAVLGGNSVHMDRFFMMKEFPKVNDHLHYRNIDVSSIMEFGWRHNPTLMKLNPKKIGAHTAKSDILESIAQLKWYRDYYLKLSEDAKEDIEKLTKIKESESESEAVQSETEADK